MCLFGTVSYLDVEEYAFLVEDYSVIKLVTIVLKSIETDSYTFGMYLPMLFVLKIKLEAPIDKQKEFDCKPLVVALQRGLKSRFGNLMNSLWIKYL